jgi:hypothetical protein
VPPCSFSPAGVGWNEVQSPFISGHGRTYITYGKARAAAATWSR